MCEIETHLPAWLPPELAAWVQRHGAILADVFASFERDGTWPAPGRLQRALLASGRRVRLVSTVEAMPAALGSRAHAPDEVRLSLFGLGCVPGARPLLDGYVAILDLARSRYAQPNEPARLSRADVADQLDLSGPMVDRVSVVLLADHPFLGGGQAGLADWELDIDERIVDYDGVTNAGELLEMLAEQRGLGAARRAPSPSKPHALTPIGMAVVAPDATRADEFTSLLGPVGSGVPARALETYARWWQLESYLREVVYVELRARWGDAWTDHLSGTAPKRAARDDVNAYMASADAGELLAYADVADLFRFDRRPMGHLRERASAARAMARHRPPDARCP